MRQYVVDELRPHEREAVKDHLDRHCEASDLAGLYWLRIPDDILGDVQKEHGECSPFFTAVELGDCWVKFEMLVRSRNKIRCDCVAFATSRQRTFILEFVDALLAEQGIRV